MAEITPGSSASMALLLAALPFSEAAPCVLLGFRESNADGMLARSFSVVNAAYLDVLKRASLRHVGNLEKGVIWSKRKA